MGCDTGGSSPVANGQMSTSQNPKQKLLLLLAASAGTHSVGSEAVLTLSSVYKQKPKGTEVDNLQVTPL